MIGACLPLVVLDRVNVLLAALEMTDATLTAQDRQLIESLKMDEDNLREGRRQE